MSNLSLCFITPSYVKDFERCKLLCKTKAKFSPFPIKHYIVVDASDLDLFKSLENEDTVILEKEKLLPWWIKKIPLNNQNVWLSLKTLPIRGWLIQQIIKIAMAHYVQQDVLIFADSDVFFIRDFTEESFIKDGKVRLYRKPECINFDMEQGHRRWYDTASDLLCIPPTNFPANDYINQLVTWRKDNVIKLCNRIEEVSGKNWIQTLCECWNLSEYILYGMFVDALSEKDEDELGHYFEATDISLNYYLEKSLSKSEVSDVIKKASEDHIAIMLSAKANIPIEYYESIFS